MSARIWVLGAPDPEMVAIEALLIECGEAVTHATIDGARVHTGNAYAAPITQEMADVALAGGTVYLVECIELPMWGEQSEALRAQVARIDHHSPGDPGYGRPPAEFLAASSLGQVISELGRLSFTRDRYSLPGGSVVFRSISDAISRIGWAVIDGGSDGGKYEVEQYSGDVAAAIFDAPVVQSLPDGRGVVLVRSDGHETGGSATWLVIPQDLVLTAAADHCLGAAYRGECPGVDPDDLMRWRVESRAKFQGRSPDAVLADVEFARRALADADTLSLGSITRHGDCDGCGRHIQSLDGEDWDYCECPVVRDLRHARVVTTVLVAPFADGATVDAAGVGDGRRVVYDAGLTPCASDEGGHHTFVDDKIPELVEAAARDDVPYISGPFAQPDGRRKLTCSGKPEVIDAFFGWAARNGLVDTYGDPVRGFAGGYLP